jgi:hypothetical protein
MAQKKGFEPIQMIIWNYLQQVYFAFSGLSLI